MSETLTGILYFGFPMGSEPDLGVTTPLRLTHTADWMDANKDWEEEKGPKRPEYDGGTVTGPAWDKWRAELQQWESTSENIKITWSGAEGNENYYVHVVALRRFVEYEDQTRISPTKLALTRPVEEEQLKLFCERFGIPYKQPYWYLAAKYF